MRHYDYIFAGGGLAAMMVLLRMRDAGLLNDKRVLVIDPQTRRENDRTWCWWERPGGEFDTIATRIWDAAYFIDNEVRTTMQLAPYQYKMLRGVDFFNDVRKKLEGAYDFLEEKVISYSDDGVVTVRTDSQILSCNRLFNSIFDEKMVYGSRHHYLRQHFIGWTVRTKNAVFDPEVPIFMDFSVKQKGNTRFMYVLPISETEALVEYTLFSKELLPKAEYEGAILEYLQNLGAGEFTIREKEHGSIPMTVYPFHKNNTPNVAFIGSAGGWTKASTGYTFANTIRRSRELVSLIQNDKPLDSLAPSRRFQWYDALFINVLYHENGRGHEIFSALLADGNAASVFKFLNEETTPAEEIAIILRCPKALFLRALGRHLLR